MHKIVIALFLALLMPLSAQAEENVPSLIKPYVSDAAAVGSGRLNYVVWHVYDATLYAPRGQYRKDRPFALSLNYLRSIKGRQIADKSVEEMRKQGFNDEVALAAWHEQMRRVFTDVTHGTVLTGIRTNKAHTIIFKDGKQIGVFTDPEFTRHFFDIWLSPNTSAPGLRKALLGNKDE